MYVGIVKHVIHASNSYDQKCCPVLVKKKYGIYELQNVFKDFFYLISIHFILFRLIEILFRFIQDIGFEYFLSILCVLFCFIIILQLIST